MVIGLRQGRCRLGREVRYYHLYLLPTAMRRHTSERVPSTCADLLSKARHVSRATSHEPLGYSQPVLDLGANAELQSPDAAVAASSLRECAPCSNRDKEYSSISATDAALPGARMRAVANRHVDETNEGADAMSQQSASANDQ